MKVLALVILLSLSLTACAFLERGTPPPEPGAFPFYAEKDASKGIRRVVMMPLRVENPGHASMGNLERSLQRAMSKEHLFELVPVSNSDLADTDFDSTRTKGTFRTEDLITLSQRFGAEGVIHGIVTQYQVYPQVVLGLRLTLLDCRTGRVPWATDIVLDASSRIIKQDVQNYYDTTKWEEGSLLDHEKVLISPRLFGDYASMRIASTLASAMRAGPASISRSVKN